MSEQLDRFISLLKGIFELDKSDLDFGIYRIMNIRKKEIEKFLAEGLPARVKDALAPFAGNTSDIEKRIAEIEKQCDTVGIEVANSKMAGEYNELKATLANGVDLSGLEADVYSQLYSFFNRYYEEGDFISKRRYKEGVYAIPYEGEEVKLYWANQDQYYIKTSENFKDYTFVAEGYNIHFRLVDATTEQNNNKESKDNKRVFMLYAEDPERPELKTFEFDAEKKELIIRFVFDIPEDKKAKYEELNDKAITTWLIGNCQELVTVLLVNISSDPKKKQNLLQKHLRSYVAKNTFDYFIHKDLKKFLTRELDFFIKNEVMHLDDVDTTDEKRVDTWLAKVRAIKRVGHVIIDFLASIEDFQKKLWLKKKFVVQCDYCITLDRIPERFYKEIWSNEAQLREWQSLGFISNLHHDYGFWEFTFNGKEHQISIDSQGGVIIKTDFKAKQITSKYDNTSLPQIVDIKTIFAYLLVDTKFFNQSFKEQLLACIDNFDEQCNGVTVKGDNFQTINFLHQRFNGLIKLIYIDPPYNTDASKILYKNGYEHSSWVSLMDSRLAASKALLSSDGVIEVAIDDYEYRYLNIGLDQVFGRENAISNIAILTNPKGRDQGFIAQAHDYTLLYAKNKSLANTNNFILSEEELAKKFAKKQGNEALRELPLKRTGSGKYREERPYMYFPFFFNKANNDFIVIPEDLYKKIYNSQTNTFDDNFLDDVIHDYQTHGYEAILPLSQTGEKYRWRWGYNSCKKGVDSGVLFCKAIKGGSFAVYQYDFADEEATPKSLWVGERYDASSKGTNILNNIIPNNPFDFPKSLYTVMDNIIIGSNDSDFVLDYFAGSGTTGHAILNLNRENNGNRRYILADMGEYFDTVLLARVKKVVFSPDWKNGKPLSCDNGISHCFKYMRLESYEDALSNVELPEDKSVERMVSLFGDEYLIKYMLDLDTAGSVLNLAAFNDPFDYKLNVTEKNETKEVNADLMETFNYLIGLTVDKMYARKIFSASPDPAGEYEGAVKLIGNDNGEYIFRQIEGTLPSGERALIIWRNLTDNLLESNAALDAYFQRYRINPADREYDVIYVNGDNNIANLKSTEETWKVRMIEPEFKSRMFEEE